MLEIIVVYFLCKGVGDILRKKNRNPLLFQIMTVVFWIGGEVCGFGAWIVMIAMSGQQPQEFDLTIYLFGLGGAAAGAGLSFLIAFLVPAAQPQQPMYGYGPGQNFTGAKGDPTNPYSPPQAQQNPFADQR
jgi:hypothetical protein